MKTRILIFSLILFLINETISGQENADTIYMTKFKHALGFGAGFTTGYGLSYRFTPNKFGVQANFAPYIDKYFNNGLGIGIEFIILKRLSLNLMGGYACLENFKRISFTGETGLFYKF